MNENDELRLSLLRIGAERTTLSGRAVGRQMLAAMIAETEPSIDTSMIFVDFEGVDIATGSFLREAIVGFRDFCRRALGTAYPVIANANPMIEEELSLYLDDRRDAMWSCSLGKNGEIKDVRLLGSLDPIQDSTLRIVLSKKAVSAPMLSKMDEREEVGVTAWNNRLSNLADRGLIVEAKIGKTKEYRVLLEFNHGR